MPIRPETMALYPGGSITSPEWREVQAMVRRRSGDRCEGSAAFPFCRAANGEPHPRTGSIVVLTVAHLNHDPRDSDPANLAHWCQLCHNTYDGPKRRLNAARTLRDRRALGDLFCDEPSGDRP